MVARDDTESICESVIPYPEDVCQFSFQISAENWTSCSVSIWPIKTGLNPESVSQPCPLLGLAEGHDPFGFHEADKFMGHHSRWWQCVFHTWSKYENKTTIDRSIRPIGERGDPGHEKSGERILEFLISRIKSEGIGIFPGSLSRDVPYPCIHAFWGYWGYKSRKETVLHYDVDF